MFEVLSSPFCRPYCKASHLDRPLLFSVVTKPPPPPLLTAVYVCVSHDKSQRSAAVYKTSDILYELFLSPCCWAVMWKLVQFEEEISCGKKRATALELAK